MYCAFFWEVLNGVGVDGVRGIFVFLCFSSFFFVFLRFSPRGHGETTAIHCKKYGISLRPRLHRPRSKLPDFLFLWGPTGTWYNLWVHRASRAKVSEMASAKTASAIVSVSRMRGRYWNSRIGCPFGENSAGFSKSVWLPGSILNFRIGSVSSIGGVDL